MKINPKIVNRIREKVINYLIYKDLIPPDSFDREEDQKNEQVIDQKVLYYLQVGEDVLDVDIKREIKKHKDWMKKNL